MFKKMFMVILSLCLLAIPYQATAASTVATSVTNAEKVAAQVNAKIMGTTASKIVKLDANLVKKLKTNLDAANKKVNALKKSKTKTTYSNRLKKVNTIYKNALTYQKVYTQGTKVNSLVQQLEKTMKDSPNSYKISTLKKQLDKELATFKTQLKTFYSTKTKAAFTAKFQTKATKTSTTAKHLIYVKGQLNTLKSYISSGKSETQITQTYNSLTKYIKANLGTTHRTYFTKAVDNAYSDYNSLEVVGIS